MGKQREHSESDIYHVVARGSGRQLIFEDDFDRAHFMKTLSACLEDQDAELYAWCLMSNHVHLLVHAPIKVVSCCMQKCLASYARYYNAKSGHVGHLFQGRFWSEPVDGDEYLLAALCYIHNNPVKDNLSNVYDYPWSSYQEYSGAPGYCSTGFVLDAIGGLEAFREAHENLTSERFPSLDGWRAISDELAAGIAKAELGGILLSDVKALNRSSRNQAIGRLKRAGLSIRQIERLTGIGRNVIQRAK